MIEKTTDRQERIPHFKQEAIRTAKVLCAGAGRTGNEVLAYELLSGFGYNLIADMDTISRSNLSSTVLFTKEDIGKSKARTAAERFEKKHVEDGKADPFEGDLCYDLGDGVIRHLDLVFGCVDNLQTRFYLSHVCKMTGKPYIDTGIEALDWHFFPMSGEVNTPCFACLLGERAEREAVNSRKRNSCDVTMQKAYNNKEIPTIVTSAGSAASLAVAEAVKALHAQKVETNEFFPPQYGVYHSFNGQTNAFQKLRPSIRKNCPHHEGYAILGGVRETPISAHWTLRRTLDWVKETFGEEHTISLIKDTACVNRGFVSTACCKHCGKSIEVYRPLPLQDTDLLCGECRENHLIPKLLSDSSLKLDFSRADEPRLQEMTLLELGIPLAHIVEFVPEDLSKESLFLELTADIPEVMPQLPL